MFGDEFLRQLNHVFRLRAKKTDGLYQFTHAIFAEGQHFFRRVGKRKQRRSCLVDAGIGRLGRKHNSHQKRKWINVLEFSFRFWISCFEATEGFLDLRRRPLRKLARLGLYVGRRALGRRFDFRAF